MLNSMCICAHVHTIFGGRHIHFGDRIGVVCVLYKRIRLHTGDMMTHDTHRGPRGRGRPCRGARGRRGLRGGSRGRGSLQRKATGSGG